MGHCVAGYAPRAVSGHCYLFHVECGDHRATVEIDAGGRVRQAYGPRNRVNDACRTGAQILARWSAGWPALPALLESEIPF